jgi:hypothetical protein
MVYASCLSVALFAGLHIFAPACNTVPVVVAPAPVCVVPAPVKVVPVPACVVPVQANCAGRERVGLGTRLRLCHARVQARRAARANARAARAVARLGCVGVAVVPVNCVGTAPADCAGR